MRRLTQLGFCAIATAWLGCGLDDGTTQSAGTPQEGADEILNEAIEGASAHVPAESRLQLSFHRQDGSATSGFSSTDEVRLRTMIVQGSAPFAGGEFAFVVVDSAGHRLSMDALACRRFRIEKGAGGITDALVGIDITGAPCQHAWDVHGDGSLMLELASFTDAPADAQGVMHYTVLVAPVDKVADGALPQDGVFPSSSYRASFTVQPTP
jgi:hypothetical protein